ncbi:MAG: hypothetical protein AAGA80_16160 [Cyanobacteria bacterium P01_F01_bin.143]
MNSDESSAVIVTISDQYLENIQAVAAELESAGMKVNKVLKTVGIITGSMPSSITDTLSNLEGVVSIEPDRPMQAI